MGIRIKLRPLERAAYYKAYAEKTFKNVIQGSSGAFGNAATRIQAFVARGGAYTYGNDAEIDALFDALNSRHLGTFQSYVDSVHEWWEEKGFLTEKQYNVIKNAAQRSRR